MRVTITLLGYPDIFLIHVNRFPFESASIRSWDYIDVPDRLNVKEISNPSLEENIPIF